MRQIQVVRGEAIRQRALEDCESLTTKEEFLQLDENTGYFLSHEFLPQSWPQRNEEKVSRGKNNGIVISYFYAGGLWKVY